MRLANNYFYPVTSFFLTILFLSFGFSLDAQNEKMDKKKDDKTYIRTTEKGTVYEVIGWQEEVVYNPYTFTWFAWEEPIVQEKKVKKEVLIPVSEFTRPPVFSADGTCLIAKDKLACSNNELQEYVTEKWISYPQPAESMGQEGLEYVTFTLNEDGEFAGNLKVVSKNDPCAGCADKAADIVAGMEDMWYPAIKDGKTVTTELTIPIRFELRDN